MLVLWLQERGMRALAWWGGAYLMGASAVTLWGAQGASARAQGFVPPEMPNALLFIACGMIWSGARLFHGRCVLPGALFFGAAAWFVAMQFADFAQSDHARLVLSSHHDRALRLPHRIRAAPRAPEAGLRRACSRSAFHCCTARCSWRRSA